MTITNLSFFLWCYLSTPIAILIMIWWNQRSTAKAVKSALNAKEKEVRRELLKTDKRYTEKLNEIYEAVRHLKN